MKRRSTPARAALLAALLAGALAACGTTEADDGATGAAPTTGGPASDGGTDGTAGTADGDGRGSDLASCADDDTPTSTEPVTLTDSFGRTVELAQPAQRVAVLEWQQIEDVLTLCVTPIAVADGAGYTTWDSAEVLPEGVEDVGGRGEPNLDALFAANPDLIIVEAYTADDAIIGQLEAFGVPVLATSGADAADPIQHMLDLFGLIAQATGRTARAEVVVDAFRAHLADAQATVAASGLPSTDFIYLDGYIEGGNVALRPFGQGSLVGELGEALGLTNVWTGDVDPAYGLGVTDIEGMAEFGDATFFYTGTEDPAAEDIIAALQQNPIWSSLPAVTEDRVHPFPPGIWTFGGPRSSQQVLDAYVELLTA